MSRIEQKLIAQIKERLKLSKVVSRVVSLKRAGRDLVGRCPFHAEKTPSFKVDDDKGLFYCFGCHESGDIISFVQKTNGLKFADAVKELADQCGVKISPEETSVTIEEQGEASRMESVNKSAADWFARQLQSSVGKHALEYLRARSIPGQMIEKFQIGFSAHGICQYLESIGHQRDDIDKSELDHWKFRQKLIFPIIDSHNRVLGFGARSLNGSEPKYINSSESVLFHKKLSLYGENLLSGKQLDTLIVVEGYVDAIALHKIGLTDVVATLGTSITTQHLERLWEICDSPTICMDGDDAGLRATHKIAKAALPLLHSNKSLFFVRLPSGHDPDSAVKVLGWYGMRDEVLKAKSLPEVMYQMCRSTKSFEDTASSHLSMIKDAKIRSKIRKYIFGRLYNRSTQPLPQQSLSQLAPKYSESEVEIVRFILENPDALLEPEVERCIRTLTFKNRSISVIVKRLLAQFDSIFARGVNAQDLVEQLKQFVFSNILSQVTPEEYFYGSHRRSPDKNAASLMSRWTAIVTKHRLTIARDRYAKLSLQASSEAEQELLMKLRDEIAAMESLLKGIDL